MLKSKLLISKNNRGNILPLALITIVILGVSLQYAIKKSGEVASADKQRGYEIYKAAELAKLRSALQNFKICSQANTAGGLKGYTPSSSSTTYVPVTTDIYSGTNYYLRFGQTTNISAGGSSGSTSSDFAKSNFGIRPVSAFIHMNPEVAGGTPDARQHELIVNYEIRKYDSSIAGNERVVDKYSTKIQLNITRTNTTSPITSCYALQDRDDSSSNNKTSIDNACTSITDVSDSTNMRFQYGKSLIDVSGNTIACSTRVATNPTSYAGYYGTDCSYIDNGNAAATGTSPSFSAINGIAYTQNASTVASSLKFTCGTWKTQSCTASTAQSNYTDTGLQTAYMVNSAGTILCRDPIASSPVLMATTCTNMATGIKAAVLYKPTASSIACVQIGCNVTNPPSLWGAMGQCYQPIYNGSCAAGQYVYKINYDGTVSCRDYLTAKTCGTNSVLTQLDFQANTFTCTSGDFSRSGAPTSGNIYIKGNGTTSAYSTYSPGY